MADQPRNRLADETSPYLRQHATNPVDWRPWGDEALEEARDENKPIFLSVGYSACHWCHVMERESFEDDEIAGLLNDYFVNIKVDREERPDLDRIYMNAVQLMSGQGGWPMSVWLTPDLQPFYAGTYFPPRSKWGRPGFVDVVREVHRAWTEERERVDDIADEMSDRLAELADPSTEADELGPEPIRKAADDLSRNFDPHHGGFGTEPKFPAASQCRFLLGVATDDRFDDTERTRALEMVEQTLVHMASGGMYDHLGGGFHRYSTDSRWLIPHFEKMLYDNALLLGAYREAFEATGRGFYRRIVEETAGWALEQMRDTESTGAFFSSQDADSEGEEGKFFVWTPEQLREVLGDEEGRRAADYWGVTDGGNFENGTSALNRLEAIDVDAGEYPAGRLDDDVQQMRRQLLEARERRVRPDRDDKIIASWNGLMIEALALAGRTLGRDDWIEAAQQACNFILDEMCVDGRASGLRRIHHEGRTRHDACLDDYANLALAAAALYEATGDPSWLDDARRLVDEMIERFERDDGGFYYSVGDRDDLIVRQTDIHDRAMPSATSRAFEALWRVGVWTGEAQLEERLGDGLQAYFGNMTGQPGAMTNTIRMLDAHLAGPLEIVCVRGETDESGDTDETGDRLERAVSTAYRRHGRAVIVDDGDETQPPVVRGKSSVDGRTAVYVCRRGQCAAPVVDADAFVEQLNVSEVPS